MHQSAASPPTKSSVVKESQLPVIRFRAFGICRLADAFWKRLNPQVINTSALLRLLNAGDVVGATAQFAE